MKNACEVCHGQVIEHVLTLKRKKTSHKTYSQCQSCGLVRLENPDYFDYTKPACVDALMRQAMSGQQLWNWTMDRVEEHARTSNDSHSYDRTLVEVGCGVGTQLSTAQERGWQVRGYDINPILPEMAKTLHGVDVRCEDFTQQRDQGFADVVLMNQLVEHVTAPLPFLEASRRVLKPNGLLMMSTPNWNAAAPLAWYARKTGRPMPQIDHIKPEQHIRLYQPRTFERMAADNGWKIRGMVENRTDLLGNRSNFSARRVLARASRAVAAATGQQLQLGVNLMVVLQAA